MTILIALAFSALSHGQQPTNTCPPQINLPHFFYTCKSDADCAVAGDNCRACGDYFIINKKFIKELEKRDQLLREKYDCNQSCEPCDIKNVQSYCVDKRCSAEPPPPSKSKR